MGEKKATKQWHGNHSSFNLEYKGKIKGIKKNWLVTRMCFLQSAVTSHDSTFPSITVILTF